MKAVYSIVTNRKDNDDRPSGVIVESNHETLEDAEKELIEYQKYYGFAQIIVTLWKEEELK